VFVVLTLTLGPSPACPPIRPLQCTSSPHRVWAEWAEPGREMYFGAILGINLQPLECLMTNNIPCLLSIKRMLPWYICNSSSRPKKKIYSIQHGSRLGELWVFWGENPPPKKDAWNKHWQTAIQCLIGCNIQQSIDDTMLELHKISSAIL